MELTTLTEVKGPELAKLSPSVTYGLEIGVVQDKRMNLTKHEASRRSISFFMALITSFGTELVTFGVDNEIED